MSVYPCQAARRRPGTHRSAARARGGCPVRESCECYGCGVPAYPRRYPDDGEKYRCGGCGEALTWREGSGGYYAFFPRDLYAALRDEVGPLDEAG